MTGSWLVTAENVLAVKLDSYEEVRTVDVWFITFCKIFVFSDTDSDNERKYKERITKSHAYILAPLGCMQRLKEQTLLLMMQKYQPHIRTLSLNLYDLIIWIDLIINWDFISM